MLTYVPFVGITILSFSACMMSHYIFNNNSTTGTTSGAGTAYLSGASKLSVLKRGSGCSIFSFLCNILLTIRCFFFPCSFSRSFCVLLPVTATDYPFGMFKLFWCQIILQVWMKWNKVQFQNLLRKWR